MSRELITRYAGNPIVSPGDWPGVPNTVFNPGVAEVDGETLLLVRVENRDGLSHLGVATSADGLTDWRIDSSRVLQPDLDSTTERFGIEDPRITFCDGAFQILYTGYSTSGPLVCLASTTDFRTFTRHGVILPPENKDAAIFPERIGGRHALLHRPVAGADADIWLAWSEDLVHWGEHTPVMHARDQGFWDAGKVGLGPPPLLTDAGWLVLYHGVRTTASGSIYRLGLALLDRDHPERVLARCRDWVFGPSAPYERVGDVGNVVFPCGWLLQADRDTLRIYYGAADTCIGVATASVTELLAALEHDRA